LKPKQCDLERLFVDVEVVTALDLLGLAEEDEVLEQEDVAEVFPAAAPDNELILAPELALLFQVHLKRKQEVTQEVTHMRHTKQCLLAGILTPT